MTLVRTTVTSSESSPRPRDHHVNETVDPAAGDADVDLRKYLCKYHDNEKTNFLSAQQS